MAMPLQELVDQVEAGVLPIQLGPVLQLDQISVAHAAMEQTSTGENCGVDLTLLCHKSSFALILPQQGHCPIRAISW
jgi:hypothetical protein